MIDPSKSLKEGAVTATNDNKILQDAGLSYQIVEGVEFTVGQFKAPTTAEGLLSSADLLLPERSIVSRTFGDKREIGAMLVLKKDDWFKFSLMGSNGGNPNTSDVNTRKDVHARLDVKPFEHLSLGTFASYSDSKDTIAFRNGVNFSVRLGNFFLNGEGVTGMLAKVGTIEKVKTNGFYVDLGYDFAKRIKPVLRYEYFKLADVISTMYSAGLSYSLPAAKAKVQLSYTYLNNATTDQGSPKMKDGENGNLVIANFQVAF